MPVLDGGSPLSVFTRVVDGGGVNGLPPYSDYNATQKILVLAAQQLMDEIIASRVGDEPTSTDNIGWGPDRLIPYMNLGIIEIMNLKPDAYNELRSIALVPGATQVLPDDATGILDVINLPTIEKAKFDLLFPLWMSVTAGLVKYVITDDRTPQKFYVYPPQATPATESVAMTLLVTPDDITDPTDDFPLDDTFQPAMVDYLVYRALAEETTIPNALVKAEAYHKKFIESLGIKSAVEKQTEDKGR